MRAIFSRILCAWIFGDASGVCLANLTLNHSFTPRTIFFVLIYALAGGIIHLFFLVRHHKAQGIKKLDEDNLTEIVFDALILSFLAAFFTAMMHYSVAPPAQSHPAM